MESMILATKSGTPIIGQIAVVMGWIMNAIYKVLEAVGIQNLGLCIIIFSILIYLCMTPLQIKQQKFSNLRQEAVFSWQSRCRSCLLCIR